MNHLAKTIVGLAASTAATVLFAVEPAIYRCERLIHSGPFAFDIDDEGEVAGQTGGRHAATWPRRHAQLLPPVTDSEGLDTIAYAIGPNGVAGGAVYDVGAQPVLWMNGVGTRLPTLKDGFGAGGTVTAVNGRGHAAGRSSTDSSGLRAALWRNDRVIDLGALGGSKTAHSWANGINAGGTVVGASWTPDSRQHAVQWTGGRPGSPVDLGASAPGAPSEAHAVNRAGVVVGYSHVGDGPEGPQRPMVWIDGVGFEMKPPSETGDSVARDINDSGTVVGGQLPADIMALVWPHYSSDPVDLNTRLDADGCQDGTGRRYHLTSALAINRHGVILAEGYPTDAHAEKSFRLIPIAPR